MSKLSTSKKSAVMLSYISIVLQALSTMVLTRIYLNTLGDDAYGLYQMIYSVAQYILILDLGINTVMVRYISEFEALGDRKKVENFAFHFTLIVTAVSAAIILIGIIVNVNIENIYRNLTAEEYVISHQLFRIMIIQLVFTVISHYFHGICEAYDRFTFVRAVSVIQIILNFILIIVFLKCGMGILGITFANTVVIVLNVLVTAIYAFTVVKFKIKFHYWDLPMLRPAFVLMLAMLLQAVVGHVNSSVDKTILGIMATKTDVVVYSIAATIVTMFNTIPTTISSVFQPSATRIIVKGAGRKELTDFVIKPGRLQFMLIGGFIAAFTVFGKDFIECWAGKGKTDAWLYVLVILVPNSVPLMQNICLAILNAKDKRIFRSIILAGMTLINIGLTIVLIKLIGPLGAPLATGISYVIGHGILMNIYYEKRINLDVKRMFAGIFSKIWICVLLSFVLSLPLVLWKCNGSWIVFIAKSIIYCIVYAALLYLIGANESEKQMLYSMIRKVLGNRL